MIMSGDDAYVRVRVPGEPRLDGSVLVYLPDGTGLVVHSSQLQAVPGPAPAPATDLPKPPKEEQ